MTENNYTSITTHEGLMGVRNRRSMYLGTATLLEGVSSVPALVQTVQELVSNSIDEYVEGYGSTIDITYHTDNTITIEDKGRGIPKGPDDTFDDVYRSMTVMHSSGKFDDQGYSANGIAGLNGVGLKATNACSKWMELHVRANATTLNKQGETVLTGGFVEYRIKTHMEDILEKEIIREWKPKDVERKSATEFVDKESNETLTTFTKVSYCPDDGPVFPEGKHQDLTPVFESVVIQNEDILPRMKSSAFLNGGVVIRYKDERTDEEFIFTYEHGLADFARELAEDRTVVKGMKQPLTFDKEIEYLDHTFRMQAGFLFTTDLDGEIKSFANGVPTKSGGPHVKGFETAITTAFTNYAKDKGLLKASKRSKKEYVLKKNDVLEGLVGAFELRLPSKLTDFVGQTKDELACKEAGPVVRQIVTEEVTNWLYDHESIAKEVISKMIDAAKSREAAVKARQEAKAAREKGNNIANLTLVEKFKKATGGSPATNEMFIVEGQSAGNMTRDKVTQAVLPLRGKLLNVQNLSLGDVLKNEEIKSIVAAQGAGIGSEFNLDDIQYGKTIIMTDRDTDGQHILALCLTFFFRFMRPYLTAGHVYVADLPLYRATKYVKNKKGKSEPVYKLFYNESEMSKERDKLIDEGYTIQRFKGLGEMNPEDVGAMGADPKTRRLIQVTVDDVEKIAKKFNILMGKDSAPRKVWLDENVDFNEE